jgi:hypothetical protein
VTHRTHEPSHVPDLLLEQYRLGELPPAEIERLRRLLAEDERLRARLQALEASDAEIRRQHPLGTLAGAVRQRLDKRITRPTKTLSLVALRLRPIAAATAALLVLVLGWQILGPEMRRILRNPSGPAETGERIKGGSITLFRKTADGSEVLGDGAKANAGDLIRIGYRAEDHSHGIIFSIDGSGIVTRHFPQQGNQAAPLARTGQAFLDHAYELDDAPGWERFYFVTGKGAFDVTPVLNAAQALAESARTRPPGKLALPAALDQSSVILMKEISR